MNHKIIQVLKLFKIALITFLDFLFVPVTVIASILLKLIRLYNVGLFKTISPFSKIIFQKIGVFPIVNHYYEPYFYTKKPFKSFRLDRSLPGINFNIQEQLNLLNEFNYCDEIIGIANLPKSNLNYSFLLGPFGSGDSEILYNIIRHFKPKNIIEIGCGHSSLMIQHALKKNTELNYNFKHICVEPYEAGWIAQLEVSFIKKRVEELDQSVFDLLENGDILFIDSSHIIRPQGDVLFEYLEILPKLKPGVIVHIHDVFSPKDYLDQWLMDGVNFWNEQYLLEAFLTCNNQFKIICATNFLKNNYFNQISSKCPILTTDREPGSFWIQKII
jgi:hypothetical protein